MLAARSTSDVATKGWHFLREPRGCFSLHEGEDRFRRGVECLIDCHELALTSAYISFACLK